jgi:hypothetical protein
VGCQQVRQDILVGRLVGGGQALGQQLLRPHQVVLGHAQHDLGVAKLPARVQIVLVHGVVALDLLLQRRLLGHDLVLDLASLGPLGGERGRGCGLRQRDRHDDGHDCESHS